jgi:hypothetical protein
VPSDLVAVGPGAPEVPIDWVHASMLWDFEITLDDSVAVGGRGGSGFRVDRTPAGIGLVLNTAATADAILHPVLTIPLSVLARWRGDVTLHAGAFETAAGAWAVLGEREAGKSTMLAALGRRGVPVVADDLLAIQDGAVWPGPNCVDLRPDAARRLDAARSIGEIGGRERFRLSTTSGSARPPLRGMFVLDWHTELDVVLEPLTAAERLKLLYDQEYIALLGPADPRDLLRLMDLPAWRLTRPSDWGATSDATDRLLAAAASAPVEALP